MSKRIVMKVSSLVVCWGLIFLYFSKIIEETSHYPVSEIVYYTMIVTMALVFLGGLKFSGWILSKKGDTEEETEGLDERTKKKRKTAKLVDMGTIKNIPKDTGQ